MKNMLKSVVEQLADVKHDVRQIKQAVRKQDTWFQNHSGSQSVNEVQSKLPQLPVKTEEELDELCTILTEASQHKILSSRLAGISGGKNTTTINNIVKAVLDKEMQVKYTVHGKVNPKKNINKKALMKLNIYECMIAGAKASAHCVSMSEHDISKQIGIALTTAKLPKVRSHLEEEARQD